MREKIINMLLTAIKESLGEEYLVDSSIIKKNNNTKKYAISIRKRNEQVAPILYIDSILEDIELFKSSLLDGTKQILSAYQSAITEVSTLAVPDLNKSYVLKHVYYQLIHAGSNEDLIRTVPHKRFLDLAVVFRVSVGKSDGMSHTFILSKEMTEKANLTLEELDTAAGKNTKERGFSHTPLSEILHIYMPEKLRPYVLTNPENTYGANILLFPEELAKTAAVFEEDFYLIPSSIHELMAYPVSSIEKEYLLEILRSVNADPTVVKKEEVLGYRIYRYNRKTGTVTFA